MSGNLYARLVNNTGDTLSGLLISYDVEKYRNGSNPAGFRIQLFYSFDGSSWTSAGPDFLTSFAPDADNSGFANAPGATVPVSNKTLNVSVASGANIYLAWNYSVTSGNTTSNAQALAIDNVSIQGVGGAVSTNPGGVGNANPNSVLPGESSTLTVAVTPGTNPASTGLAVTADLSSIGGSASQEFFDDGVSGDATGVVDVRVDVAASERQRRSEHRPPPVQTGVARARHRSPPAVAAAAAEPEITMLSNPVYRPLFALFFVALFVYVLRETFFEIRPMEERAALFPMVLGIPCLALAVAVFVQELFNTLRGAREKANPGETISSIDSYVIRSRAVSIVAWTLGFFLAIWLLGFVIAVPVASFLYFKFAGREKWTISTLLSLAAGVIFYGLFDYILHLPFPEGELLLWLDMI